MSWPGHFQEGTGSKTELSYMPACRGSLWIAMVWRQPQSQMCLQRQYTWITSERFFRSLLYLCASANYNLNRFQPGWTGQRRSTLIPDLTPLSVLQIHTHQPGLLTHTLWVPLCFVLLFRAPGDEYWSNSQNSECFYWQWELLCWKIIPIFTCFYCFRTPCAFCCKTTDKNIKKQFSYKKNLAT